jgi:hypothetical protein
VKESWDQNSLAWVDGNDLLKVSGHIDRPLFLIDFHGHLDRITGLALSTGAHLGVNHHHVPIAHIDH